MHKNEMFYALIFTNNHIITWIDCMLSSSIVTKFLLSISLIVLGYFLGEDVEDEGRCEEFSKRSTCKGLSLILQVGCILNRRLVHPPPIESMCSPLPYPKTSSPPLPNVYLSKDLDLPISL